MIEAERLPEPDGTFFGRFDFHEGLGIMQKWTAKCRICGRCEFLPYSDDVPCEEAISRFGRHGWLIEDTQILCMGCR